MTRRRAGATALYAMAMTAGLWAAQPPTLATRSPESHAAELAEARQGERTVDLVEALLQRLGGEPARPGVRPLFIPSGAIVVAAGTPTGVDLATALSGRAGSVVAWIR